MLKTIFATLVISLFSQSVFAADDERTQGEVLLYWKHVIFAGDYPLPVESWFQSQGIPHSRDSSVKELTIIWNTTESGGRPQIEPLCEVYTTTEGWTIYVHDSNAKFVFATTCPSQG